MQDIAMLSLNGPAASVLPLTRLAMCVLKKERMWCHSGTLREFRYGDVHVELNQIDLNINVSACGLGVRANLKGITEAAAASQMEVPQFAETLYRCEWAELRLD